MPSLQPPVIKDARLLDVDKIRFSQSSVGSNFKDGRSVEQLTNDMTSGKKQVWDIPPIRVYETNKGNFVTHDNRRLKVVKDADVKKVPVVVTEGRVPEFKFTTADRGQSVAVVPSRSAGKGAVVAGGGCHGAGGKSGITTTTQEVQKGAGKAKGAAMVGEIFRQRTVHNARTGVTEVTKEYERYQVLPDGNSNTNNSKAPKSLKGGSMNGGNANGANDGGKTKGAGKGTDSGKTKGPGKANDAGKPKCSNKAQDSGKGKGRESGKRAEKRNGKGKEDNQGNDETKGSGKATNCSAKGKGKYQHAVKNCGSSK